MFGPSGPELKGVTELHGPDPLKPHPTVEFSCGSAWKPAPEGSPRRHPGTRWAGAFPSPAQGTGGRRQPADGESAARRRAGARLASRTFLARPGSSAARLRGPGGCGRRSPRPARAGRGPDLPARASAVTGSSGSACGDASAAARWLLPRWAAPRAAALRPHARRSASGVARFLPWRRPRVRVPSAPVAWGLPRGRPFPRRAHREPGTPRPGRVRPPPAFRGRGKAPAWPGAGSARRAPPAALPCPLLRKPPEPPRAEPRWRGDVRLPDAVCGRGRQETPVPFV